MKYKKILLIVLFTLLLSGCVNIENENFRDIINVSINSKNEMYNTYRKGYKFYLPKSLYVLDNTEYNEIIKGKEGLYYLYVDVIGYLNKNEIKYTENKNLYYSSDFSTNDKRGYIEIKSVNDEYLVEIVYNYAKIEVMVNNEDLRASIANSIIILSSINYNDSILKNTRDTVLNYKEDTLDIFKSNGKEKSNFLQYVENDEYKDESNNVPDYDVIK